MRAEVSWERIKKLDSSLKQTNAVKDIPESALIAATVLVELTVVGAHLHRCLVDHVAMSLSRSYVFS